MSLGVGLEQEVGDELEGGFGEFDEFGGAFAVFCCCSCQVAAAAAAATHDRIEM